MQEPLLTGTPFLNHKFMDEAEACFKPFYTDGTKDAAHGWDHIQDVLSRLAWIAFNHIRIGFPLDNHVLKLGVLAALAHDIFTQHRAQHHMLAGAWVRENANRLQLMFGISSKDIERIALACERHRASYDGVRDDVLQELVAAADYGCPGAYEHFERALRYRGEDTQEAIQAALEHVAEKFYLRTGKYSHTGVEGTDLYRIGFAKQYQRHLNLASKVRQYGIEGLVDALGGYESNFWEGVLEE